MKLKTQIKNLKKEIEELLFKLDTSKKISDFDKRIDFICNVGLDLNVKRATLKQAEDDLKMFESFVEKIKKEVKELYGDEFENSYFNKIINKTSKEILG